MPKTSREEFPFWLFLVTNYWRERNKDPISTGPRPGWLLLRMDGCDYCGGPVSGPPETIPALGGDELHTATVQNCTIRHLLTPSPYNPTHRNDNPSQKLWNSNHHDHPDIFNLGTARTSHSGFSKKRM